LSRKKILSGSFNWSNTITHYFFETILAKNISPNPKGLMGFLCLGGYIFVWGAKPPKPMPGYVPGVDGKL